MLVVLSPILGAGRFPLQIRSFFNPFVPCTPAGQMVIRLTFEQQYLENGKSK